jgi:hypothetical protein
MKTVTTFNKLLRRGISQKEGSIGGEDVTSSMKEEDDTSEESSSEEAGASNKRAPRWL